MKNIFLSLVFLCFVNSIFAAQVPIASQGAWDTYILSVANTIPSSDTLTISVIGTLTVGDNKINNGDIVVSAATTFNVFGNFTNNGTMTIIGKYMGEGNTTINGTIVVTGSFGSFFHIGNLLGNGTINSCEFIILTTPTIPTSVTIMTPMLGTPCNDGDATTTMDSIDMNCACVGMAVAACIADTTRLSVGDCDPTLVGMMDTMRLMNQFDCDSTVITTTTLLPTDTTNISATSCDPGMAGMDIMRLMNIFECDSVVITTTTLLPSDTTNIAATSCDPGMAGMDTMRLVNQFDCDSIVITTTTLLPSDTIRLTDNSCDPGMVGMDTMRLMNQFDCDSTVITTTVRAEDETCINDFTTYNMSFSDPCRCDNPLNTTLGNMILLEDTLIVDAFPGQIVQFSAAGSSDFLDENGDLITNDTFFDEGPAGMYKLQFYRPSGVQPVIMITFNDGTPILVPEGDVALCICAGIPTLSQWGIIVLSMMMLIFGVVFVRIRKRDQIVVTE